jgi:hypothetical protein
MWEGDPSAYLVASWSQKFAEGDTVAVRSETGEAYNSENGLSDDDVAVGTYHYLLEVIKDEGSGVGGNVIKVDLYPEEAESEVHAPESSWQVAKWSDKFKEGSAVAMHSDSGFVYTPDRCGMVNGNDTLIGVSLGMCNPQNGDSFVTIRPLTDRTLEVKEELKMSAPDDDVIDLTAKECELLNDILEYVRQKGTGAGPAVDRQVRLRGLIRKLVD